MIYQRPQVSNFGKIDLHVHGVFGSSEVPSDEFSSTGSSGTSISSGGGGGGFGGLGIIGLAAAVFAGLAGGGDEEAASGPPVPFSEDEEIHRE